MEADRARDRERKRREWAAKRAATPPPPLPAAPGAVPIGAQSSPPTHGAPPPAGGALGVDAGAGFSGAEAPPLPWQADSLRPLFEQLIEAAEAGRVGHFLGKCAEAKLTGKLVKEIEADAGFPKAAKILLARSLPRLAAKWLNKAGLSAEYEDEVAVVSALILIVQQDRKLSARLDKLIAAVTPPRP